MLLGLFYDLKGGLRIIIRALDFPVAFHPCFLYNKSRCMETILQKGGSK